MDKPVHGTRRFTSLEAMIDAAAHRLLDHLPQHGLSGALVEFLVFGLKQAWACLFGGVMLGLIILSKYLWTDGSTLPHLITRYDFLFLSAVTIQLLMLLCRLETLREAKVILIFHIVGTAMEIFKTHMGSWIYPEENLFRIGGVPLFSGFMYAAVGSYMARINRIFDIRLANYPPLPLTFALATGIYINFFSHHYLPDMRWLLFAVTALMFWRSNMHYRVFRFRHRMPLLLAFFLTSLFIWIAENIGTWSRVWLYPGQHEQW
ncbi:MAG: DUF817 domain-containing protein, partial [Brucellaceae bacterium]|nr:DUF817 domain-containing protein [Brucellaceae bacterium]